MKIINLLFIFVFFYSENFGQSGIYIPVTTNSPHFTKDKDSTIQLGACINNYGNNINVAALWKRKILIFSVQENMGANTFDPLNFNDYYYQGEEKHLILSKPTDMLYCELGVGYTFNFMKQKLSLLSGIGQQFENIKNTRYYLQLDWGDESPLIDAGVSLRVNYTMSNYIDLIVLEPMVQGKIKIGEFRIINQFGYSIAVRKNEDYMKPVLTIGLAYVL